MGKNNSNILTPHQNIRGVDAIKYSKGKYSLSDINIAREMPLTINLNGDEVVTILTSSNIYEAMAIGFLRSEGLLKTINEVESIIVDVTASTVCVFTKEKKSKTAPKKRMVPSGCGMGTVFYHALDSLTPLPDNHMTMISPDSVHTLMSDLYNMSDIYRISHGVHNTAIADTNGILIFQDDIGRHNAVDILFGIAMIDDLLLNDKILLTTGRITSEIVLKIARMGVPVLISKKSATSLAVELAVKFNITLIGLTRVKSFIIYSCPQRVMMKNDLKKIKNPS